MARPSSHPAAGAGIRSCRLKTIAPTSVCLELPLYWRRAWFVDVANRYAGHVSGLKVGFVETSDPFDEWRCYAINYPRTVANDLPRLLNQAKKLFIETLSCEACVRSRAVRK